ncbi:bifunctional 4-hydroxy-3-methylbut-2-enyl diphosphate reductase/30S ribosomal protein S1 [Clostridium sp. MB40-C1]|uniref:bifunctional 4-hydroxy-3-methylbut-2-enyl diphosphate reductase/30S ribosomal protein S1 n=1 Tax=Clostridium sp. MB40-C1 TaxID=3070996 RepID=UPI0027DEE8E4|nr:bifunctional 4-hydroxy-3-methylbut-2-enyl diphosphate reductase/30S ribosomal protein S1 [Clostridium sp. MB40-C1]WMJ81926.1 bifunctional 4-hydroxy-3-methylbut-2-enyl diphosphate reductase/30S ribosomal protein S1 [Clostridium sp. MB40-C1]
MRNIILASKAGFCFGVKRAVDKALSARKENHNTIYTLGPLIHNKDVVNYLESKNINSIDFENIDKLNEKDVIVIRSHGTTPHVIDKLKEKKLTIIDSTCPHVSKIHHEVEKYHKLGYDIVIVGDSSHPEVIGINGWCDNSALITKDGSNIENILKKVCIVSQTTEKQENWEKVINVIVSKCREFVAINTICSATHIRQKSAWNLSKKVDTMIVIGGYHSSNTTKLYELCKQNCKNTIHVENSGEIPDEIIKTSKNIGVTAGASTPDWIIKEAITKMNENRELEFNEQLAFMEQNDVQIAVGDKIKGQIISLNEREAFVNIGYKKDGFLPLKEVTNDENVKLTDLFNIGDQIEAKVISLKNDDGYVVLSKIEIEREKAYSDIKEAFNNKTNLKVQIKETVKGGLIAKYNGARVFIPASHLELHHVDNLASYIGKTLDVNIIEYKPQRKGTRIVASRRDLLIKEKEAKEVNVWESLEKGKIVEGEVKRLTKFGAFVDINGIDGLLHVSQISWGRIEKPEDVLKVRDKVKVCILDLDKDNRKLSLSIKSLIPNPWLNVEEKYPIGNVVLGKVVRFADFGAFIEIEPGVDGLVHISEISHKRINKPNEVLNIGDEVKAKILNVSNAEKRISLSIKEVE